MCWCITGSNVDVDIEFEDDMNMGKKIELCDKVVAAIREMQCPTPIASHQISGLDYGRIQPVLQWLIQKLSESRDTRAKFNRRQGLLNYNRFFAKTYVPDENDDAPAEEANYDLELAQMKETVFRGKPKRIFLARKNVDEVPFPDPKRVHQCLREFND